MKSIILALCLPIVALPAVAQTQKPSTSPANPAQPSPGAAPSQSQMSPGQSRSQSAPGQASATGSSADIDCSRWKVSATDNVSGDRGGAASTTGSAAAPSGYGTNTAATGSGSPPAAGSNTAGSNASANNSNRSNNGSSATAQNVSAISTQEFVSCAAMSDMLELQASKLAQKSADAKSKSFAKRMVKDHSETSKELKKIARSAKATIPAKLDSAHQDKLAQLKKAKGADFDKMYDEMQVEAHEAAVGMFETYSRNGDNQELKAFADKHLPHLREHLNLARDQKR